MGPGLSPALRVAFAAGALAACTNVLGKFKVGEAAGAGGTGPSSPASATTSTGGSTALVSSSASGMPAKRAFVSDNVFAGNFGGAATAHMICQKSADDAKLGGTWVAWIANGNTPITCSGGPWFLVDGATPVGSCDDLYAGTLKHPIDTSEKGAPPSATVYVWTGLAAKGFPTSKDCMAWSVLNADATVGSIKAADPQWSEAMTQPCDATAHLYCFEN